MKVNGKVGSEEGEDEEKEFIYYVEVLFVIEMFMGEKNEVGVLVDREDYGKC